MKCTLLKYWDSYSKIIATTILKPHFTYLNEGTGNAWAWHNKANA